MRFTARSSTREWGLIWEARIKALTAELATIAQERDGLKTREAALVAALHLYGCHHSPCPKNVFHAHCDLSQRCTCGLDEAITGIKLEQLPDATRQGFAGWLEKPCQNCGRAANEHPGIDMWCPRSLMAG